MTKIQLSTVILNAFLLAHCTKLVGVDPPKDTKTTAEVFANDSLAQAAVMGLYIHAMSKTKYLLNGGITVFAGLSSDELLLTTSDRYESPFAENEIAVNNPLNYDGLWTAAYTTIFKANMCMEGLNASTALSPALKSRLLGEVTFMRALCFYSLVNLYGKVPLTVTSSPEQNRVLSRSDVVDVYRQIGTDLLRADSLLPDTGETSYPTGMACKALLSQLQLYQKDWQAAVALASAVIDSRSYSLETDLNRVFRADSKETIFQLAPVISAIQTAEGKIFIPPSEHTKPAYHLGQALLGAFEPADRRRTHWVGVQTYNAIAYHYPHKYKNASANGINSEYNIVLRLAQQYLIRAEARLKLGDVTGCLEDMNTIRSRAGLPGLPAGLSPQQLAAALEQENRIEFFSEWGHRWFDLKRWGRAAAVLGPVKSGFEPAAQLYPIPLQDIQLNSNLDQNPGYN